jgi:NAD(P) transhydrogenase
MLGAGATKVGLLGVGALLAVGSLGGVGVASRVGPTELPQTVAAFHSLVGLAAALTGIGEFLHRAGSGAGMPRLASHPRFASAASPASAAIRRSHSSSVRALMWAVGGAAAVAIYLATFLGSLTATGSVVAFGKLQGILGSKPVGLPKKNLFNAAVMAVNAW